MARQKAKVVVAGGIMAMSVMVSGGQVMATDFTPHQPTSYEMKESGITYSISGYTYINSIRGGIFIKNKNIECLKKLDVIATLKYNWDGNGANPFPSEFIAKVREIVLMLEKQPELFPTACETIQLEYDKPDGAHLEIEIFDDNNAELYILEADGTEVNKMISVNAFEFNKAVNEFYG